MMTSIRAIPKLLCDPLAFRARTTRGLGKERVLGVEEKKSMTVKERKEALEGVACNMVVAMADEMSVVFAEAVNGAFVISDLGPGDDESTNI